LQKTCGEQGCFCVITPSRPTLTVAESQEKLIAKGFSQERVDEITNYLRGLITNIARDELSKL
jgi:prolyl-tRNA editing enzyme YbaK/EbsC (Cys-tRNA(Pro) deacylase)